MEGQAEQRPEFLTVSGKACYVDQAGLGDFVEGEG